MKKKSKKEWKNIADILISELLDTSNLPFEEIVHILTNKCGLTIDELVYELGFDEDLFL